MHININELFSVIKPVKTKDYISHKYLLLILAVIVTGIMVFQGSLIVQIISMWALCASAIMLCGMDFFHPYFWYSSAFSLYSTAYPILRIIRQSPELVSPKLIPIEWFALVILLFIVSPRKTINSGLKKFVKYDLRVLNSLIFALGLYIVFCFLSAKAVGITGKSEMRDNLFFRLIFSAGTVLGLSYAVKITAVSAKLEYSAAKMIKTVLLCGIPLILVSFTGERDYLFRFVIITMFTFYAIGLLKNKHFIILAPMLFLLLTMSKVFKYYFMSGNLGGDNGSLLETFLTADFTSASMNLNNMINLGLKNYLSPIQLALEYIGISDGGWFTRYMGASYGLGYTIVGVGYTTFGLPGIVIVMATVGALLKAVYLLSAKNIFFFGMYLICIYVFVYAIRGGLSTIIISLFKYGLTVYLISFLIPKSRCFAKIHIQKQGDS